MVEDKEIAGSRQTRRVHQHEQEIGLFQRLDSRADHATIAGDAVACAGPAYPARQSAHPGHARPRESSFESFAAFPRRWQSSRSSRRFSNVDFPTFDRPIIATVPNFMVGLAAPRSRREPPDTPFHLCEHSQAVLAPTVRSAQDHAPDRSISPRSGRGPLQFLKVPSELLGMLAHGKIAWKPHFAKEEGQQQQQAHAGADILCTGHPAPLPIQPLPPAITFNDHTSPLASTRHRLPTPIDCGHFPTLPRSGATDCTWPHDRSWTMTPF